MGLDDKKILSKYTGYWYRNNRDNPGNGNGQNHGRPFGKTKESELYDDWHEYIPEKVEAMANKHRTFTASLSTNKATELSHTTKTEAQDVQEGQCSYDCGRTAAKRISCGHLYCKACFHQMVSTKKCLKCTKEANSSQKSEPVSEDRAEAKYCSICLDAMKNPIVLKCKHEFCKECIEQVSTPVCPICGDVFGIITGSQPDGKMFYRINKRLELPGFKGCGTIEIQYVFKDGFQKPNHPNPGQKYYGIERRAYIPETYEGYKVFALLKTAFSRRLTFTIGDSTTTGRKDQITWNDIHHKTSLKGGPFGYPDPTYLTRVKDELAAKGIKE